MSSMKTCGTNHILGMMSSSNHLRLLSSMIQCLLLCLVMQAAQVIVQVSENSQNDNLQGVSILLADALRSAGIPARVAGTPAWNGKTENGNHNWVEVYDHRSLTWHFIEATPAGHQLETCE